MNNHRGVTTVSFAVPLHLLSALCWGVKRGMRANGLTMPPSSTNIYNKEEYQRGLQIAKQRKTTTQALMDW